MVVAAPKQVKGNLPTVKVRFRQARDAIDGSAVGPTPMWTLVRRTEQWQPAIVHLGNPSEVGVDENFCVVPKRVGPND